MPYFLTPNMNYYEGDRAHRLDLPVPQRPTSDHRWEAGQWVVDAPEVLLDRRAQTAIDSTDRLQFEHLFELENRTRVLEVKLPITRAQYRDALIARWKQLNG